MGFKFIKIVIFNFCFLKNSLNWMMWELNRNESSRVFEVLFLFEVIKDVIENVVVLDERCDCVLCGL